MAVTFIGTRDIPLTDLTRFPGNARRGDLDEIRSSIRRHGQYRSIVVRDTGDSLVILAGNHTSAALQAEGHTTARCDVITCTDKEATQINLADNRMADLGDYDDHALAELLASLDGDFDGIGYNVYDVDSLSALLNRTTAATGPGPTNPRDEWQGMPDFEQPSKEAVVTTHVHFKTQEDADAFFKLIERPQASSWWWPEDDGHVGQDASEQEVWAGGE